MPGRDSRKPNRYSYIGYYVLHFNKNAEAVFNKAIKEGKTEDQALVEKSKVKISGAPFLKAGTNMIL